MKKNLLAAMVFLLTMFFASSKAQDTIHLHNGGTIDCLVKEIGTNEIKYVKEAFREDLVFSVIRKDVLKIAFADGNLWENDLSPELLVNGRKDSEDLYNIQKKNAWKMEFLNLVGNTFTLTYERALKNGNSLEFSAGYIGIGMAEKDDNATGVLLQGGYKLLKSLDFFTQGTRYPHILKGKYLKFELGFANYGYNDYYSNNSEERLNLSKWSIMTVIGKSAQKNQSSAEQIDHPPGDIQNGLRQSHFLAPGGAN